MHHEARVFVHTVLSDLKKLQIVPRRVVEIGSYNVNGGVRDLLPEGIHYIGVDLRPGDGVDMVADGADYAPEEAPNFVICCEVLEHAPNWRGIVSNAHRMLAPYGVFIVTAATEPRPPHSRDGALQMPPGEYYGNIDGVDLEVALAQAGFYSHSIDYDTERGDVYAVGFKGGS